MTTVATTERFDLAVVGGGSGGMACAKEAARLGKKVCLFDYVEPSTQGTRWGLGGTCVNVGCVPKKLMHHAGFIGALLKKDAGSFGWKVESHGNHDWGELVQTVQNHIKSLNFGYKHGLRSTGVKYFNHVVAFQDNHTLTYQGSSGQTERVTADYVVIAVGGRPHLPADVPGAREFAITSDDLFSLKRAPGKTLVVGGAYIALECAGFLTEIGNDVTVCVRSVLLRAFDQQCAEKIGGIMAELGTKFIRPATPVSITKQSNGQLKVTFTTGYEDTYDTVLFATGRDAKTSKLNLSKIGVHTSENGKVVCENDQTSVPNIYAIGDCQHERPELTPVAIKAGEKLAQRLFAGATTQMDYNFVPTTIFTPIEYGCCGLSERSAEVQYGSDHIEVYLSEFSSLEAGASHREKAAACRSNELDTTMQADCLVKLICHKLPVSGGEEKVIGFHFVGPSAGEITQGIALAMRLGATKADFDNVVAIHPTNAESVTQLVVTRRSGASFLAAGGCGGGKCG